MRTVCCVCHVETKPEDGKYPHGDSHGYCPKHLAEARAKVDAYKARRLAERQITVGLSVRA